MIGRRNRNLTHNRSYVFDSYIFGQGHGDASLLKLGFFKASHNGCGWVAIYNCCRMLGLNVQPYEIIDFLESINPLRIGFLGVHLLSLTIFFIKRGFKVRLTLRRSKFDERARGSQANVLFCLSGLKGHYFAFNHDGSYYRAYNVWNGQNEIRSFLSINRFIKKKGWFFILLSIR